MLYSTVRWFWPDLRDNEIKKFGILAVTFLFTVGAYWMLRLLKDSIFYVTAFPMDLGWAAQQGAKFLPTAKIASFGVVIVLIAIYSKLVDWFEKQTLFYIICSFYGLIFAKISVILFLKAQYGDQALGWFVMAVLGWVSYFAIESFGSIIIALFWSFANSITDSDSAKRGFPFVIAFAQIGAIGGSALNIFSDSLGVLWPYFVLATFLVMAIALSIYYFMQVIPASEMVGNVQAAKTEKKKEGFIQGFLVGIKLLLTRPYLFGVLILSTVYEIINTIVDYQMKCQAAMHPVYKSATAFNKFLGIFGVATNTLALVMAALGTSYLMKRYGLTFCLLVFPVSLGLAVGGLYVFFQTGPTATALLWATFGVMMIAKGLSYAVNNPSKEMMYIPTSKDAKFKTKSWIDMFGGRGAKALGSGFNDRMVKIGLDIPMIMTVGTLFSLGLIGVWMVFALSVGRANKKLIAENRIIE